MPKRGQKDEPWQDWKPVVWKKHAPKTVKEAKARGFKVETRKRIGGSQNLNSKHLKKLSKIEQEDETFVIEKVSRDVRKAIQKGRTNKSLTQKDLAKRCNVKPQLVNDYEAGRTKPNPTILRKMQRILGVKLLGKNIGDPM